MIASEQIGDTRIKIPSYDLFDEENIWVLVSRDQLLSSEFKPELSDVTVPHGDANSPMKVATVISDSLESLVNAAKADGHDLMLSSAHRSREDQQRTYDGFVAESGTELANLYVLPPGGSEHQTGLAVDFSSASTPCELDSDDCSLSTSDAAWLADNASRFGFILRYPEGKTSATSVRYEPWHYRYLGPVLAQAVDASGLTYEEVIEQIVPGYLRSR